VEKESKTFRSVEASLVVCILQPQFSKK